MKKTLIKILSKIVECKFIYFVLNKTIVPLSMIVSEQGKKFELDKTLKENPTISDITSSLNISMTHSLKEAREQFEKSYLINQIKKNNGNVSKTADFIGMERSALHRKLKILGIKGLN